MEHDRTGTSPEDLVELLALIAEPAARDELPGSRNRWPACGAETRGNPRRGRPAGGTCRASGCGFNGRCLFHGGANPGPALGQPRAGKREPRRLVLFSQIEFGDIGDEPRERRRWHMAALPLELVHVLGEREFAAGSMDSSEIVLGLGAKGVPCEVASKWPQRLGFRIVALLAERGRIAYGLFTAPRDVFRATREHVGGLGERLGEKTVRVEAYALLEALYAAGARRPRSPWQPGRAYVHRHGPWRVG